MVVVFVLLVAELIIQVFQLLVYPGEQVHLHEAPRSVLVPFVFAIYDQELS